MHALETLFSQYSLKFQIVSNSVRMHILDTLFFKKKSSIMLQIVPNSVRAHALSCTILPSMFSKLLLYLYLYIRPHLHEILDPLLDF